MNLNISRGILNKRALILVMAMLSSAPLHADYDSAGLTERFVAQAEAESDNIRKQIRTIRKLKRGADNKQERAKIQTQIDELRSHKTDLRRQLSRHKKLQRQRMAFTDEFGGTQLAGSNWSHEANGAGGGNNEQQCYTKRTENSFVADGKLYLVAKEEAHSGASVFDDDPAYNPNDISKTQPFTSAR